MPKAAKELAALEEVADKLDLILRVMALQIAEDKSVTERARLLKMAGLDNQTIAEVLNTSVGTIRVLTSNLRKRKTGRCEGNHGGH